MPMIEIDQDELDATRSQAASAMPWKNEAHRLASALYEFCPDHALLRGEVWEGLRKRKNEQPLYSSENGVIIEALEART